MQGDFMPYLFAHFKEKITPDGEQVYFSVSRDGFNWEKVNNGNPVVELENKNKEWMRLPANLFHLSDIVDDTEF
jgi:hypothetical protein